MSETLTTGRNLNVEVIVKALDLLPQAGWPRPDPHPLGRELLSLLECSGLCVMCECVKPGTGQQEDTLQALWRVGEEATRCWSFKE